MTVVRPRRAFPASAAVLIVGLLGARQPVSAETEAGPDEPTRVTIAAVGDILFGRYVKSRRRYRRVPRIDRPFRHVRKLLSGVDIAFGNLECPVMPEPKRFHVYRSLTFRAEPEDPEILARAGFDVISVANNHTLNLGFEGARLSKKYVEAAGLVSIGAGASLAEARAPQVVERNGARIAFVGRTAWTNGRRPVGKRGAVARIHPRHLEKKLARDVREAREQTDADFVVVSIHWGDEKEPHPGRRQRRAARAAIDAGADLILGHHPHVVQDIEIYRGGVIVYSLGNFLFDHPARVQRESVIFTATLVRDRDGRRVEDATAHPVVIHQRKKVPEPSSSRRWRRRLRRLARGVTIAR